MYLCISGKRSFAIRLVSILCLRSLAQSTFFVWEMILSVTEQFWRNCRKSAASSSESKWKRAQTPSLRFSEKNSRPKFPVSRSLIRIWFSHSKQLFLSKEHLSPFRQYDIIMKLIKSFRENKWMGKFYRKGYFYQYFSRDLTKFLSIQ